MKAILLAAERGVRRIQAVDSYPRALIDDENGQRVLDWIIGALNANDIRQTILVGGYHIEKLIANQPALRTYYNADWAKTGSAYTLMVAQTELDDDVLVSQTDVVYHASVVRVVLEQSGDVVLAVAPCPAAQAHPALSARAGRPVRFAGLMRCTKTGLDRLRHKAAAMPAADFHHAGLDDLGLACGSELCVIADGWALVDSSLSMARFVLGSKSQTLDRLRGQLRSATVLDQVRFSSGQWTHDRQEVLDRIAEKFAAARLVVRSSAKGEDSWTSSQAGRYESILDVDGGDSKALSAAIDAVIASYEDADEGGHEVFVQPFLSDIASSGVIFTRDPESGAPYLIINYDCGTGRSDTVTGGHGEHLATAYVLRGHQDHLPSEVAELGPMIDEMEQLLRHDALDLEFATDRSGRPYLLQVRPITPKQGGQSVDERDIMAEVQAAVRFVEHSMRPQPGLLGASTVFASMPDWNPAEIIGTTPRPLAVSLYRHLVMDDIWSASRAEMGYRAVRSVPLMKVLAGHPFVDVRATFNSFLPASLPDALAAKLADHTIERLRAEPRLQDKVEFEIVFTCLDFSFFQAQGRLEGFSAAEIDTIRHHLARLTHNIVTGAVASTQSQFDRLDELDRRRAEIVSGPLNTPVDLCRAITALLEDCRSLGTLPFANLARQGFVATALLRSLCARGVLTRAALDDMLGHLPTVAGELSHDLAQLAAGRLSRDAFLDRFGHLRPGTYDILSPSYGERPDLYFDDLSPDQLSHYRLPQPGEFEALLSQHHQAIAALIDESGLGVDVSALIEFCAAAIPGREWGKFVFSRNLSTALGLLRRLGAHLDLSEDDLSFLPIHAVFDAVSLAPGSGWRRDLRRLIDGNRRAFAVGKAIRMPAVITAPHDLLAFTERDAWPNYITTKALTAPLVVLDGAHSPDSLEGCIVAIEKADPGYDWLFARNIAGLVTKYGGVASHMAIRCAEFGLPAAIGCGERIFESLRGAKVLQLSCGERRLQVVR